MPKIISNKSNVDLDYPVVRPSLDLDFTQEELDPRITFSRGSIGTRVNRNRLIETVAANQPRFDYDPVTGECKGLLIEESRQNLISSSETSTGWNAGSASTSQNVIISPNGTQTANKLNVGSSTFLQITNSPSATVSSTHTFSVFLKAGELKYVQLRVRNAGNINNYFRVICNLTTGELTSGISNGTGTYTSASATKFPNDWWRFTVTGIADTSGTQLTALLIGQINASTIASVSNSSPTDGFYWWGAQLETGAFPTSYIPTSGSTVTRSPELVEMTGTNFSSWYNQTEGTFFFDGTLPFITNDIVTTGTTARVPYGVSNGLNFSNSMYVSKGTTSLGLSFNVVNNSVGQAQGNTAITTMTSSRFKIASSVADKSIYSSGYGGAINKSSRPSAAIPTVNKLSLGKEPWNSGASNPMIGCIARFTYYPRALKPSQLQYLTQ